MTETTIDGIDITETTIYNRDNYIWQTTIYNRDNYI